MIKVQRKFTYVVDGKEYADQKEAAAAARDANYREKQAIVAEIIKRADGPLDAVQAIMKRFHVFNKSNKTFGGGKRKKARPYAEMEDATLDS